MQKTSYCSRMEKVKKLVTRTFLRQPCNHTKNVEHFISENIWSGPYKDSTVPKRTRKKRTAPHKQIRQELIQMSYEEEDFWKHIRNRGTHMHLPVSWPTGSAGCLDWSHEVPGWSCARQWGCASKEKKTHFSTLGLQRHFETSRALFESPESSPEQKRHGWLIILIEDVSYLSLMYAKKPAHQTKMHVTKTGPQSSLQIHWKKERKDVHQKSMDICGLTEKEATKCMTYRARRNRSELPCIKQALVVQERRKAQTLCRAGMRSVSKHEAFQTRHPQRCRMSSRLASLPLQCGAASCFPSLLLQRMHRGLSCACPFHCLMPWEQSERTADLPPWLGIWPWPWMQG